jgi:hypothetical protein
MMINLIEDLLDDEIFVFGSNIQGIHGGGAAKDAMQWGAVPGQSKGLMGQTYGIETKDLDTGKFLGWDHVESQLVDLIEFAKSNLHLNILLTPVGTGLAGGNIEDLNKLIVSLNLPTNIIKLWE